MPAQTTALSVNSHLDSHPDSPDADLSIVPVYKGRILVVDDERANVLLLTTLLETQGFSNVFGVIDSRAAMDMYSACKPDLVLLDIHMPHMDGFEVMKALRETGDASLRILMLTGSSDMETRLRALKSGADDFLNKPPDTAELAARVRNLLHLRFAHLEIERQRARLAEFVNPSTRRFASTRKIEDAALRECSILFADIRGFTAFAERMPPAEVFRFLNDTLELQARAITDYRGEVDKFVGDAIMAVFADANDAVRAAEAMLQRCRNAAGEHDKKPTPGVGINTGVVVEGVIGKRFLRSLTVVGDAVNVAARLCGQAAAGEIVVSESTVRALNAPLAGRFNDRRTLQLKGKTQPMHVWVRRLETAGEAS